MKMDPNTLFEIPLYRVSNLNNWFTIPVVSLDDETIQVLGGRGKPLILKDSELKPNKEGKYIINIEQLDLKFFLPEVDLPKEFEMPAEVMEARTQKRNEARIKQNMIDSLTYKGKKLYFYLEGDILIIKMFGFDEKGKLRAEAPEKALKIDKIEKIHNKKAVNIEELELGHPYFALPESVIQAFEEVLLEKQLKTLKLQKAGVSKLNGETYYKLNMEVSELPAGLWTQIKTAFEDFGEEGEPKGLLTQNKNYVTEKIRNYILEY